MNLRHSQLSRVSVAFRRGTLCSSSVGYFRQQSDTTTILSMLETGNSSWRRFDPLVCENLHLRCQEDLRRNDPLWLVARVFRQ